MAIREQLIVNYNLSNLSNTQQNLPSYQYWQEDNLCRLTALRPRLFSFGIAINDPRFITSHHHPTHVHLRHVLKYRVRITKAIYCEKNVLLFTRSIYYIISDSNWISKFPPNTLIASFWAVVKNTLGANIPYMYVLS